jgi:peroxiredoxin
MQEQAQLRHRKSEVEKLGAEVYVVLAMDLYRTKIFREENLVLSTFKNPFTNEKNLVFGTALADPAGYASALYGVSRRCLRGQAWVENNPCWFVIDRKGILTYAYSPTFSGATFYEKDIERILDELRKAAR